MNRICRTENQEEASRSRTGELPSKPVATIPQSAFCAPQSRASALITTLLVLVVLSTIVVAFMQSMSVERSVARSLSNRYASSLAAQAGFDAALNQILQNTKSDDFTVLKSTATLNGIDFPVNFIGVPASNSIKYYPLFSGGSIQQLPGGVGLPIESPLSSTNAFAGGLTNIATNQLPLPLHVSGNASSPVNVAWVDLTNSRGDVASRYAYWAEDLGGYIDADLAGSKPLVRGNGTHASELAIFSLFRPTEKLDSSPVNSPDDVLIRQRLQTSPGGNTTLLISDRTLSYFQINDGRDAAGNYALTNDFQRFFVTKLRYAPERAVVPRGFGYTNAGQAKLNLNMLVATGGATAVSSIASWITNNLPTFETRKGGFPPTQNYAKTLAANIIDYADANNDATIGSDYRGVDSYPFITQYYQQYTWVNEGALSANPWISRAGTWQAKIRLNVHLQLWNPSDKIIDSGVFRMDLSLFTVAGIQTGNRYAAYQSGSEIFKFHNLPSGTLPNVFSVTFSAANRIQPNQYFAWSSAAVEYWLDTGISSTQPAPTFGTSNPGAAARPRISLEGSGNSALDSNQHGYRAYWNGGLVDQPGAITHGDSTSIFLGNQGVLDRAPANGGDGPDWRGGQPGLRHGSLPAPPGMTPASTSPFLLGDPRGTFYIRQNVDNHSYQENASWLGRNKISPSSSSNATTHFYAEARTRAWPDGAYDAPSGFGVADSFPGSSAQAIRDRNAFVPVAVNPIPSVESSKAPGKISNSGTYTNALELRHVYDPLCWRPNFEAVTPQTFAAYEIAWRTMGNATNTMVSDHNYVAPSSLRIGRGEFFEFDQQGKRASQLLDLFDTEEFKSTQGKININTAGRDVLRTLGAGLIAAADPDIIPQTLRYNPANPQLGLAGPFDSSHGDKLADAIIAARPFVSLSKMSNIKVGGQPFFGNMAMWSSNGPTQWNDAASEEYFARLFNLSTVRSRNFRVFVAGIALNSTGKVISKSQRVYQVFINPVRDATGEIVSQQPIIVYETDKF